MDLNIDMTWLVFLALFGAMSLTVIVAAIIAKALDKLLGYWDQRQYVKTIAKMYRH